MQTIEEEILEKTLSDIHQEIWILINKITYSDLTVLDHRELINKLLKLRRKITLIRISYLEANAILKKDIEDVMLELIGQGIAKTPAEKDAKATFRDKQLELDTLDTTLTWMEAEWNTMHRHLTMNQTEFEKTELLLEKMLNTKPKSKAKTKPKSKTFSK